MMGSGSGAAGRSGRATGRRRREGRPAHDSTVPAVPGRRVPRRVACDHAQRRRARSHEGARIRRRAAVPGRRHDARRRRPRRHPCDRRPLRPGLEGVHAGDGGISLRRVESPRTEAPLHGRHRRRRHPPQPRRRRLVRDHRIARARRSSTPSAATARSAPTRNRSRSSDRRPGCTPRGTSSTTRRSRDR